ncbi:hypothetical protein [Bergeyella cardium]|uniref:Uncharacterized protein n=1 Tax=Bergeyella cardium TaxID=1585976 RepID=A0A6P1QY21_9FLAO|nr:hypothetical protein [Bergeyella cardium]QHN65634.1 hypothetical protein DBX24_06945 [Bergeyella cardium]WHE33222.1 hypothetical protein P8603_06985 [Bergeyella cardium]WHF59872.1 hypothetical protein O0R51_06985 [Bergeyella cardium]
MRKSVLYFVIGTTISFIINYFILNAGVGWQLNLFYGMAFGLGWGLAYFVDQPKWKLHKKMSISFIGIIILLIIGRLFFNSILVIPSIIRFSTVFVAYYLIASFKQSKSLRQ